MRRISRAFVGASSVVSPRLVLPRYLSSAPSSNTPPADEPQKEAVSSVPVSTVASSPPPPRRWHKRPLRRGVCVAWNSERFFGRIMDLDTEEVFFVHKSGLIMTNHEEDHHRSLHVFQLVEFDTFSHRLTPKKKFAANVTAVGGLTLPPGPMEAESADKKQVDGSLVSLASTRVLATPNATVREDFISDPSFL